MMTSAPLTLEGNGGGSTRCFDRWCAYINEERRGELFVRVRFYWRRNQHFNSWLVQFNLTCSLEQNVCCDFINLLVYMLAKNLLVYMQLIQFLGDVECMYVSMSVFVCTISVFQKKMWAANKFRMTPSMDISDGWLLPACNCCRTRRADSSETLVKTWENPNHSSQSV